MSIDEKSGFEAKKNSLFKMTTLAEKEMLFYKSTPASKLYLFMAILREDESIGFDLLHKSIKDSTELDKFCSCVFIGTDINLELINYYYRFAELKYKLARGGTFAGWTAWYNEHKIRPDKKEWNRILLRLQRLASNINVDKLKGHFPQVAKDILK